MLSQPGPPLLLRYSLEFISKGFLRPTDKCQTCPSAAVKCPNIYHPCPFVWSLINCKHFWSVYIISESRWPVACDSICFDFPVKFVYFRKILVKYTLWITIVNNYCEQLYYQVKLHMTWRDLWFSVGWNQTIEEQPCYCCETEVFDSAVCSLMSPAVVLLTTYHFFVSK